MIPDERAHLLEIALKAHALLDRLDTCTPEELRDGADVREREALREALRAVSPLLRWQPLKEYGSTLEHTGRHPNTEGAVEHV